MTVVFFRLWLWIFTFPSCYRFAYQQYVSKRGNYVNFPNSRCIILIPSLPQAYRCNFCYVSHIPNASERAATYLFFLNCIRRIQESGQLIYCVGIICMPSLFVSFFHRCIHKPGFTYLILEPEFCHLTHIAACWTSDIKNQHSHSVAEQQIKYVIWQDVEEHLK